MSAGTSMSAGATTGGRAHRRAAAIHALALIAGYAGQVISRATLA